MFYLFIALLVVLVVLVLIHEPMLQGARDWVLTVPKAWSARQQKKYEDYQAAAPERLDAALKKQEH